MAFISMADARISLNGFPVNSGLIGDSDAIEFPQEVEQYMRKMGVRGEREWGRTGERGGEIKIKTMATSFMGAYLRQRFEIGRLQPQIRYFRLVFEDTNNKQIWTCTRGVLIKGPYGPKAGSSGYEPATWTLEFEDIAYDTATAFFAQPEEVLA